MAVLKRKLALRLMVEPPDDYDHTHSELAAYTAKLKRHFPGFAGFIMMDPGDRESEQPPEIGVNITNGYEWPGDGAGVQFVDSFGDVERVLRELVPLVHGSDRYNAIMAEKATRQAPAPVIQHAAPVAAPAGLPVRMRTAVHATKGQIFVDVFGNLVLDAAGGGVLTTADGGRYVSSRVTKSSQDPEELKMVLDPATAQGLKELTVDLTRGKTTRLALAAH